MSDAPQPAPPSPPFFSVPNLNNLRDVALYPGGLPTSTPGTKVRSGILFRSAEVSKLDREGWEKVREIGVSTVFDLRSKPEAEKGWRSIVGDKEKERGKGSDSSSNAITDEMGVRQGWLDLMSAAGIKRVWVPVFEESDYSPERLAERYMKYMDALVEGFVDAYHDILVHGSEAYRKILLYLASLPPVTSSKASDEPIGALVHCTAGKDRTGIFFGVLLAFLGVPDDLIAAEYNLTEVGLAANREALVARLMQSPGFKKFIRSQTQGSDMSSQELADLLSKQGTHLNGAEEGSEVEIPPEVLEKGRQAALRMVGAKKESMLRSLEMVQREWGSAEGYLRKGCGLRDEEIEKLRRVLVVPVGEAE